MRKEQVSVRIHNKTVYSTTTNGGWAITIMPDEVVIDNYHSKGGHIHLNPENHYIQEEIKHDQQSINLNLIFIHIRKNKGLILEELIGELK